MRRLFAVAAAILFLPPPGAAAQERQQAPTLKVEIDGRTMSVPAPFGYCDLDADHRRDRLLIEGLDHLPQKDEVLRRLAPCEELADWRAARTQEPIEVLQILSASRLGTVDDERSAFLRRAVQGAVTGRQRVLTAAGQGFPADASQTAFATLGLAERNDRAAIQAQAVMARIDGQQHRLAVVTATTAVGPSPVIAQVLAPYDDGSAFDWMLRDGREHVDRLLSANGEASRRFGDRRAPLPQDLPPELRSRRERAPRTPGFFDRNGGVIALGLVIGGAVLIAAGLLVARRLRPAP